MDNANDKNELQIDNLIRKLESKRENSQSAVEILGEIMQFDRLGIYSFKYLKTFKEVMDNLEKDSVEIINLWTKSNLTVQIKYANLLENVIDAAELHPEKYSELWLKTIIGNEKIAKRPGVLEKMLKLSLDNIKIGEELTKDEYTILYGLLHFAPEIENFKDQTLVVKAINVIAIKDAFSAINVYNRLTSDVKQIVVNDINWKLVDENLKKDLESNRNDPYGIIRIYNEVSKSQIEEFNIEQYKRKVEKLLKENPEETLEQVFTLANIKSKDLNYLFIEMLIDAQKKGKYLLSSNEKIEISINGLKELLERVKIEEIPDNIKLLITAENISQLSSEFLSQIEGKVEKIRLRRGNYYYDVYSFEEIKMCRQVIDKLLNGIDLKDGGKNSEKKVFTKVVKRLARHIKYDYELVRKEDHLDKLQKKVKDPEISEKEKERITEKIKRLNIKKQSKDARTMLSGLLKGKAVCAGYAEIVNQVFSCLGIEAKEISGKPENR